MSVVFRCTAGLLLMCASCSKSDTASVAKSSIAARTDRKVLEESAGDVVIPAASAAYSVMKLSAIGSVAGQIAIDGVIAARPPAGTGRDSAACGPAITDESAPQSGGGLGGAVIWLDGVHAGKSPNAERRVELESNNCKLAPRVQAAIVGSAVNIIGHDEFRQHLRFTAGGETQPRANILLSSGEQVIPTELPFKAAGLVSVSDAEHPWTRAYLAVFDHPYFAVSTVNGSFAIDSIPPGTYTLHVWHERAKAITQQVTVGSGAAQKLTIKVTPAS